jgi:hypothetical protein
VICQRPYDTTARAVYTSTPGDVPENQIGIAMDHPITVPEHPILDLDDSTIDEVMSNYIRMDQSQTIKLGNVTAVLPGGGYLFPWHQFALTIINQSVAGRPIYFASSGNAAAELGVQDYLVRQGLAFRLINGPMNETAPSGSVAVADRQIRGVTGPWVDVPRTQRLVEDVFEHHTDILTWSHWPDRSTIGIPSYYAWSYYSLAQIAAQSNDDARREQYQTIADKWATVGQD